MLAGAHAGVYDGHRRGQRVLAYRENFQIMTTAEWIGFGGLCLLAICTLYREMRKRRAGEKGGSFYPLDPLNTGDSMYTCKTDDNQDGADGGGFDGGGGDGGI